MISQPLLHFYLSDGRLPYVGNAGFTGVGWIALTGDLIGTIDAIKSASPLLVYPLKAAVAFPLVYHYLGGVRHVFWDKAKYGNQVNFAVSSRWLQRRTRIMGRRRCCGVQVGVSMCKCSKCCCQE